MRVAFNYQSTFQLFIFASHVDVAAQVIAKRQRATLFVPSGLNNMHVMRVGPSRRPMKERTEPIVRMRHVDVPDRFKRLAVRVERTEIDD